MAADQAPFYEYEELMSGFTGALGTGSGPRQQTSFVAAGSHALSSIAVKPGSDITLTLIGAGGGGGSGDGGSDGGGGGGGGGAITFVITAANWALDGTLVVGAKGTGGATGVNDGTDGADSTITVNSVLLATCGGGKKGEATSHAGGAGGVVTKDGSVTPTVSRSGYAGGTASSSVAGPGGLAGASGGGKGGAGGTGAAGAGVDGQDGYALVSFAV